MQLHGRAKNKYRSLSDGAELRYADMRATSRSHEDARAGGVARSGPGAGGSRYLEGRLFTGFGPWKNLSHEGRIRRNYSSADVLLPGWRMRFWKGV